MKRIFILISFLSINLICASQNDSIRFKPKSNIEFFILPGLIYNHASIGYTLKTTEKREHNIILGSYFFLFLEAKQI